MNTRSSTEKYLVAADDIISHAIWTRYFHIIKYKMWRKPSCIKISRAQSYLKITVRSISLIVQITSTSGIFCRLLYQARWTINQLLSHWRNDFELFRQSSAIQTVHQFMKVFHEPQGLIIMLDHRSVLGYNIYLVY